MGYRTTMTMTRAAAEAKHLEMHVELQRKERRKKLEKRLPALDSLYVPYKIGDRNPDLTTQDMIEIWIQVDLEARTENMRRNAMCRLADLQNDTALENDLERLHDDIREGEGHENYMITVSGTDE